MTTGKKTAKEILAELRSRLGVKLESQEPAQDNTQATPETPPADPATPPAKEPETPADNTAPVALGEIVLDGPTALVFAAEDINETEATLRVINALASKVWAMSRTISALESQLSDASNAMYQAQRDREAAVKLAEQKDASINDTLTQVIDLVEQLADLPTADPAQAPADKRGKKVENKDEKTSRIFAAFRNVKQAANATT